MPVNVAMEEPNARVIRHEADYEVALRGKDKSVPPRRGVGECFVIRAGVRNRIAVQVVVEMRAIGGGAVDELEVVAVQVERMGSGVLVVEDDLNNVVVGQDSRVSKFTIDGIVGDQVT